MPIWLHLILRMASAILGLFTGAITGWLVSVLTIMAVHSFGIGDKAAAVLFLVVGGLLFLAGGYLGSVGGIMAFDRLPARCPECKRVTSKIRSDYTFRRSRLMECHRSYGLKPGGQPNQAAG